MRGSTFWRVLICGAALAVSAIACSDSDSDEMAAYDPYPTSDVDEPAPTIDDLTTAETISIAGVTGNVTVVIDRRGAPHIYAANLEDALRAQGYIMARDRFPQMEFIRRSVLGRLTEVLAPVAGAAATLQQDQDALFFGFKRIAAEVYAGLDANDVVKTSADAFTAGINAYINEILAVKEASGDLSAFVPRGAGLFRSIIQSSFFGTWEPSDILAIARYQTYVLSFSQADIDRSLAEAAAINSGTAEQSLAALLDMAAYAPTRSVYTTDTAGPGPVTVYPARTESNPVTSTGTVTALNVATNPQASVLMKRWSSNVGKLAALVGDKERGSNNWVVSGEHTQSGAPILANDPHLQLTSPAIWYYSHIVATAEGIDAAGVSFAGLPGIVLGFTKNLAWGATVTNFDVVDFYSLEDTTNLASSGQIVTDAGETITSTPVVEHILYPAGDSVIDVPVNIYTAGAYGQVLMQFETDGNGDALLDDAGQPTVVFQDVSVRTINTDPSNEFGFFLRLMTAKTIADARDAQATYFEAGSENFVFISDTGDIAWQTYSRVPQRPDAARNWNGTDAPNSSAASMCPTYVFPSAPAYIWADDDIESTSLPSLLNPEKGWISTANQDSIGVNKDGNPCNDGIYLGGDYDPGHRQYRIAQRLAELVERGDITVADMQTLQAASKSSLGETVRTPLVESLARSIASGEWSEEQVEILQDAHDRLLAWSLETPAADGVTDADVIADSVATTVFNVGITRVIGLAFADEAERLGIEPMAAPLLERALNVSAENTLGLVTFSAELGDTSLWDNVNTASTVETRDLIVARGFLAAYTALESRFSAARDEWTWGRLHTVTFTTIIPPIAADVQSIPAVDDPRYPGGFPRHSDWGAVDVGNFSLWNGYELGSGDEYRVPRATTNIPQAKTTIGLKDFSYGSGPSQRLVVEMLPEGPKAYNALPGGQSQDPNSAHHADEAEYWVANEAPTVNYTEDEVAANAELKIVLTP